MLGFVMPIEEKEPKWETTRTRINESCVKVVRKNVNATAFIDPKVDFSMIEKSTFLCKGQLPFGEWLKKLSKNDVSPRGACQVYFNKNAHLRS